MFTEKALLPRNEPKQNVQDLNETNVKTFLRDTKEILNREAYVLQGRDGITKTVFLPGSV